MHTRQLTSQEQSEFKSYSSLGRELLQLDPKLIDPTQIVECIENYILKHQKEKPSFLAKLLNSKPNTTRPALALGSLWGDQLIQKFGWSWTCAVSSDGVDFYCVVPSDRSFAIFPTYFVKGCLDNKDVDCTIMLAWNMLEQGNIPTLPAEGLENLMNGIHRIVPRE